MTGDNSKSAELKLSLVVARREKTPDSSQVLEVNSFTSGIRERTNEWVEGGGRAQPIEYLLGTLEMLALHPQRGGSRTPWVI